MPPRIDTAITALPLALECLERQCARNAVTFVDEDGKQHRDRILKLASNEQSPVWPVVVSDTSVLVANSRSSPEPPTHFHSVQLPPISLAGLARLLQESITELSPSSVAVAVVLFRRFEATTEVPATTLMMHRLLLTCILVAMKAHQDTYVSNGHIARIMGIDVAEVNSMEWRLLRALGWRVQVSAQEIDDLVCSIRTPSSTPSSFAVARTPLSLPAVPAITSPFFGLELDIGQTEASATTLPPEPHTAVSESTTSYSMGFVPSASTASVINATTSPPPPPAP